MNRWVHYVILTAALALGAGGVNAQDIPIAVVGPVTGSNAALGEQMTHGAKMAVADINAKGGLLGKKLDLISPTMLAIPSRQWPRRMMWSARRRCLSPDITVPLRRSRPPRSTTRPPFCRSRRPRRTRP